MFKGNQDTWWLEYRERGREVVDQVKGLGSYGKDWICLIRQVQRFLHISTGRSWAWWYMPIIPALGRQR
jgi:hypothetical protein